MCPIEKKDFTERKFLKFESLITASNEPTFGPIKLFSKSLNSSTLTLSLSSRLCRDLMQTQTHNTFSSTLHPRRTESQLKFSIYEIYFASELVWKFVPGGILVLFCHTQRCDGPGTPGPGQTIPQHESPAAVNLLTPERQ